MVVLVVSRAMIRLSRPFMGNEERVAVERVLESGMFIQGEQVARFEELLAERTRRFHGVAVSSGTAALSLALAALGIGEGDEVLCPALTWPSPAHCIALAGATPVLVDVDALEWNAGPVELSSAHGPRVRAAIVIDQFGFPARFEAISEALPGLPLIVDAACSLGSAIAHGAAGSFGAIACMSFHPRKVITTGEGGICLTDDPELASRLRSLRNHGQSAPMRFSEPGGNYRLTEMQAAIGIEQMKRLDVMISARRTIAARYREELLELTFQMPAPRAEPNYQTMGALLPPSYRPDRDTFLARVREQGVECGLLSYALHRLPSMRDARRAGDLDHTSAIVDRGFALPIHPGLTEDEQRRVIEVVRGELAHGA